MSTRLFVTCGVVVALLGAFGAEVHACGSKYQVANRGARANRLYAALRPASILIYRVPKLNELVSAADPAIQETLMDAGHEVEVAEDSDTLTTALASDSVDIILADLDDAPDVERELTAQRSTAIVLPVMRNPTSAAYEAAEKIYDFVLQVPGDSSQYLEVIDEALRMGE